MLEYTKFFQVKHEGLEKFEINKKGEIRQRGSRSLRNLVINSKGYEDFRGDTKSYKFHRLMTGTFLTQPNDEAVHVDHINGTRDLNHICNLRLVTPRENQVFAHGCPTVVIDTETGDTETFDCIIDCAQVYNELYPGLKDILYRNTEWNGGKHSFYRDEFQECNMQHFYLDYPKSDEALLERLTRPDP